MAERSRRIRASLLLIVAGLFWMSDRPIMRQAKVRSAIQHISNATKACCPGVEYDFEHEATGDRLAILERALVNGIVKTASRQARVTMEPCTWASRPWSACRSPREFTTRSRFLPTTRLATPLELGIPAFDHFNRLRVEDDGTRQRLPARISRSSALGQCLMSPLESIANAMLPAEATFDLSQR